MIVIDQADRKLVLTSLQFNGQGVAETDHLYLDFKAYKKARHTGERWSGNVPFDALLQWAQEQGFIQKGVDLNV